MSHLMIDIETLGTGNNARILSVGMVKFTETAILERKYFVVDQKSAGGDIDFDTVKWWLNQSDKAKQVFYAQDTMPEGLLAETLTDYLETHKVETVWANSPRFDIVILDSLLQRHGKKPISFRMQRDYRTMRALFPLDNPPTPTIAHNALDDAVCQVEVLQAILQQYNIELR